MSSAKSSRSKSTSQLKGTNSIEAEISVLGNIFQGLRSLELSLTHVHSTDFLISGVRKLKQTQLNLDYYKSKDQEENNENGGNNIRQEDNNRELTYVDDSRVSINLIF